MVFINSRVGLAAGGQVGSYAATKHALRALADSFREEVNPEGLRVLSVYIGSTASPMQAMIHAMKGKAYHPEYLLQPSDVAAVVLNALCLPRTAEVTTSVSVPCANRRRGRTPCAGGAWETQRGRTIGEHVHEELAVCTPGRMIDIIANKFLRLPAMHSKIV